MGLSAPAKPATAEPARRIPPGFAVRQRAVDVLAEVLHKKRPLDSAFESYPGKTGELPEHSGDAGLARLIVATTLRRLGEIDGVLAKFLAKPLPSEAARIRLILASATAQLLFLGTPAHAAIDIAVSQVREEPGLARFGGMANAVLRKVATEAPPLLATQDVARLNTPDWLLQRWTKAYGKETTRQITDAHLTEAALDLSVLGDPAEWAERLGGVVLPTGSVRIRSKGRIEALDGFADGEWWVQDAAAAIPARLLGDVAGKRVADLCAAPGGKTAMLAAMGAEVTAVDTSARRLKTLQANLDRLKLHAEVIAADVTTWTPPALFDAVLLDAPCLATGTIRRHPDLPYLKRPSDLTSLCELQSRLLDSAANLLNPGGTLVYCTCSLEPEEGLEQIARLLARRPEMTVSPITPGGYGLSEDWVTEEGYFRTLPFHLPMQPVELSGLDGFFAARLVRSA
jgi:16S rRNA (cytosine967-C5)-methyltransferase